MSEYRRKMEELGTSKERQLWCLEVEQKFGCSMEAENGVPPGLLRVCKLENDLLNLVGSLSAFDYLC
jgi:hypothetical protein